MHIYFAGIGGTGIGPLALIAKEAGYDVSGSDKQDSSYLRYLRKQGIDRITIGQKGDELSGLHAKKPIDWFVYSSALTKENLQHPEYTRAQELGIKVSKRDEFLNELLQAVQQKMIAIAGTHGKSTTTAMIVWLFKQLKIPVSYSVGAKLQFGDMGEFHKHAEYFVYEADEYDRNFLSFSPYLSVISGVAYDHPDIYPTREDYVQAFQQFCSQSEIVIAHPDDAARLQIPQGKQLVDASRFTLAGAVNRADAQLAVEAVHHTSNISIDELIDVMNAFPGVSRRFERIAQHIYTDYAHTPEKIQGALQLAHEVAGDNVVVVYEGLHNTRQHFIKEQLRTLFDGTKALYVVPSYRAREDETLEDLTPEKLCSIIELPKQREPTELGTALKEKITAHAASGDLVLCLTAGGGGSLDEWLRDTFSNESTALE